jgi:hypothetical protein
MRSYKKRRVGKKNKKTKRRQRKVKKISGGYNPKAQLHLEDLREINEEIDNLPRHKALGKDFRKLLKDRIEQLLKFEVEYLNCKDQSELSQADKLKQLEQLEELELNIDDLNLDISAMFDNYKVNAENIRDYINKKVGDYITDNVKNAVDDIYFGMGVARKNFYNQ